MNDLITKLIIENELLNKKNLELEKKLKICENYYYCNSNNFIYKYYV